MKATIKKSHMEMLGMTKAKLMKYAFSKIIRRSNTTGKNMNELENLSIEMTKTET